MNQKTEQAIRHQINRARRPVETADIKGGANLPHWQERNAITLGRYRAALDEIAEILDREESPVSPRPDWIAAIVRRKARIMGAHPFNAVHAALLAYESGATAHRAIRVGVERAGWETDPSSTPS